MIPMAFYTLDKALYMESHGVAEGVSKAFSKVRLERLDKKDAFKAAKKTVLEKEVARDNAKNELENLHFPHIIKIMRARRKVRLAKKELEIAKRERNRAKLEYKQAKRSYKDVRKIIRDQYKNIKSYDKFDKMMQKMKLKGLDLSKNEYIMNQFRQAVKNSNGKKLIFDQDAMQHSGVPGVPPELFKEVKDIWREYKSNQGHSKNGDSKTYGENDMTR